LLPNILIIDESESIHNELRSLIDQNFKAECDHVLKKKEVIKDQRQFYSINKDTSMIVFTEDIEFVSHLSHEYQLHPE